MRAQRTDTLAGGAYSSASFSAGSVKPSGACAWPTGAAVTPQANVARWQCEVARTLGEKASAQVTFVQSTGEVTVAISWGDQRWDPKDPDSLTTFGLTTFL